MAKAPKAPQEQETVTEVQPVVAKGGKTKRMILFLIAVVIVAVLLLAIGGIGFILGRKMSHGSADGEQAQATQQDTQPLDPISFDPTKPPVYVALEQTFTSNLKPEEGERRSNHFVLAKIQLQVADDSKWATMISAHTPKVNDIVNRILSGKTPSQIDPEVLAEEIMTALNEHLGYHKPAKPSDMPWGPVIEVLFQQLVVQ